MGKEVFNVLYHPPQERGQGLVEYALILVLIAVVVVGVLVAFGPFLGNLYSSVVNLFPS
jgi:pilus assembly protein Flp/PilA